MKKVYSYPTYFEKFKCIADKCTHSCCVGWEINIDSECAKKYRSIGGALSDELLSRISYGEDGASFILAEGDRCPFLNEKGLCRLILEYGEDVLCEICREHPRFYTLLPGREEVGLGMGCEEAARLILSDPTCGGLNVKEDGEEEWDISDEEIEYCSVLLEERDAIISLMGDESLPLCEKIKMLADAYSLKTSELMSVSQETAHFMKGLEPLDDTWVPNSEAVENIIKSQAPNINAMVDSLASLGNEAVYCRLVSYFIYRHYMKTFELDCEYTTNAYVAFALICASYISLRCLCEQEKKGAPLDASAICAVASDFSNQVEYCEDNVDAILSYISCSFC